MIILKPWASKALYRVLILIGALRGGMRFLSTGLKRAYRALTAQGTVE
jgi:hypothetical protein